MARAAKSSSKPGRRPIFSMFFLFCWFVAPFLLFSIAKGKLPTYMLPLMAPLAVMIAKYGVDCVRKHRMKALQANGILNLTFGAVAVAGAGRGCGAGENVVDLCPALHVGGDGLGKPAVG